jgi:signal transduction histidine kinase
MSSESSFNTTKLEKLSAIVTWALVTFTMLYFMSQSGNQDPWQTTLLVFFCCSYLCLWLTTTARIETQAPKTKTLGLTALMFINIVVIYFLSPFDYTAIFMVIWSALTPYFVNLRTALMVSPLWSLPYWLIQSLYWGDKYAIVSTGLFWTFNLFAIIMVNATAKEKQAREKAEQMNIELKSSHQLLQQATKQAERTRIARNIHDLLGHHLTALTINLQVASRQFEANSENKQSIKKNIDQCHALAKLLLSDVREAVSDIRHKSKIDLATTLLAITENVPGLAISLNIDQTISLEFSLTESVVRIVQESITNTLKHSHADKMSINIQHHQDFLHISIEDNGKATKHWQHGNGMSGISERIQALKGSINFESTSAGFSTTAKIPVSAHD